MKKLNLTSIQMSEQPASVMFTPKTEGGKLLRELREAELRLQSPCPRGYRKVRIVEDEGQRIKHILAKADPWGCVACKSPQCSTCREEDSHMGSCKLNNQVYEYMCDICSNEGEGYIGETAHSLWERNKKHQERSLQLSWKQAARWAFWVPLSVLS